MKTRIQILRPFKRRNTLMFNRVCLILAVLFLFIYPVKVFTITFQNEVDIAFENAQTATIVGEDGSIMRTENGGLNWIQQSTIITNVLISIEFYSYTDRNNNIVKIELITGENGIILKSTDKGLSWRIIQSGTTEHLNDIVVCSKDMFFICGDNGTLLSSTDLGESWQAIDLKSTTDLNHMASLNQTTMTKTISTVAAGDNGTFFATINMVDWFQITVPTIDNILSIATVDNILVCGTNTGTILRSPDRGYTWTASSSGITTNIFDLVYLNVSTIMGSSENGIMIRSTNSGNSWITITTPTTDDLFAVNFGSETFGISTSGPGFEIYTTDGGLTWVPGLNNLYAKNKLIEKNTLAQNYPNPFNPSTVINYTVGENSNVNIKVYDMTGKEVKTLVNSFKNAGTYSVNFNANNLSSGIYFYILRVNNGSSEITRTMKMILTK